MTNVQALTRCFQALSRFELARLHKSVVVDHKPVLCGNNGTYFVYGNACCPATYAAFVNPKAVLKDTYIKNVDGHQGIKHTYSKLTTLSSSLGQGDFGTLLCKANEGEVIAAINAARG